MRSISSAASSCSDSKKLGQHVAAGMPGDIGSDVFENLVAGEEQLSIARVEANVSRRMAGGPDDFEGAQSGFQFFAAGKQFGGSKRMKILAHLGEMLLHAGFERRWNAGFGVGLPEPGDAAIAAGDEAQMLGFGLVHGELGAGEFEQSRGHAHVIGVHVGEDNPADLGPGDAALAQGSVEGFKGRRCVHSAIDQNEARRERDQEDVYGFELEGER